MQSFVLLALCVVVIDAAVFHSIVRYGGKVKRTLQRGDVKSNSGDSLRWRPHWRTTGRQPVSDYWDDVYLVNVTFGTPPQAFNLLLSSEDPATWLIDSSCDLFVCTGSPTTGYMKRRFYKPESSTYKMDEKNISLYFRSVGHFLIGDIGNDIFTLGTFSLTAQSLLIVSDFSSGNDDMSFGYLPADGALGVGQLLRYTKHEELGSVLLSLRPQLDLPVFTLWYDRKERSAGSTGGMVTYGGYDTTHCDSHINWAPSPTGVSQWRATLTSLSYGNVSHSLIDAYIVIDSQSAYQYLHYEDTDKLAKMIGAWNADSYWYSYFVNCSARDIAPPVVYTVNGFDLPVAGTEYIVDENLGDGVCEMKMRGLLKDETEFSLSAPFLRSFCVTMDFGNSRIGFAAVKH